MDYTKKKHRQAALDNLEMAFMTEMENTISGFHRRCIAKIHRNRIDIAIQDEKGNELFASDVSLYPETTSTFFPQEKGINFGSSGAFDPKHEAPYWRTIHAAIILQNWDIAMGIVETYCMKMEELMEEFKQANEK